MHFQDCADGSDEGEICLSQLGCCNGKFDLSSLAGTDIPVNDLEYSGWEPENGRPYYANDQFTLAFGTFFGDPSMCGKGNGSQTGFITTDN